MQIDRARFLFLTASLAGNAAPLAMGGCSATPTDVSAPPAPTPTGPELVVADPGQTGESTESETTLAVGDSTSSSSTPSEPAPLQTPQNPAPGACNNDVGTVPACSINKPPGPSCESFADTKASCKGYKSALRDAIAARAVTCLNSASGTQDICDYSKSEACASAAVRTACIQPSTFNQCSPIVAACAGSSWSKLTMQECQQLLSAVKDNKRQTMVTCMTEGCSIDSCTWMMR